MTYIVHSFLMSMLLVFVTIRPVWGVEADVSLHDLQLSEGAPESGFMAHALAGKLPEGKLSLTPAFDPGVNTYTVAISRPRLTIRARAAAGSKMDANGTASSGDELKVANRFSIGNANGHGAFMSATLSGLDSGENVVTVKVSDSGGAATRSYTVLVSRTVTSERAPLGLDDLQLSEGAAKPGFMFSALAGKLPEGDVTVTPAFDPQVTSYSAKVSQSLLTVRTRAAEGVEMSVTGTAAGGDELTAGNRSRVNKGSGHGGFLSVTLSGLDAGENRVAVEVTDAEGGETRRYNVVLTRVARSAGETVRSAKATEARQTREKERQARAEAREVREKERQARAEARKVREKERQARAEARKVREKERQARAEARKVREKERQARMKEQRAHRTNGSSGQKGHDLLTSIKNTDPDGVRRAIDAGKNVNEAFPGRNQISPLLLAVEKENPEIVRLLIEAGANANYTLPKQGIASNNPNGISALLLAVHKENEEIVRLLIGAGADVNHVLPEQEMHRRSETGTSALLLAVGGGNEEIVRLLVGAGADVNYALPEQDFQSNKASGTTALLLAVSKGQEAIVRHLIQGGADVNSSFSDQGFPARQSTGGVSALMLGAFGGHEEIVRLLIEAGADVSYQIPGKRPMGKNPKTADLTALRVAKAKDQSEIVKLLRKAGAKR